MQRRLLPSPTLSRKPQPVRSNPGNLPKTLHYDGSTNWDAFFVRFTRYSDALQWRATERRDQLCWCLEGKAGEYYTAIIGRDPNIDYFELMAKIEKRFNFVDLPETLQIQFMGAHQNHNEKLEDWADRLLSLATKAFRDWPEDHIYTQVIWRLFQGCFDKEAGQHTAMAKPKTIEKAIDKIKWYQHTTKAIFGKTVRKREVFSDSDNDETQTAVNTVKSASVNRKHHLVAESDSIKSMEGQIKTLVDNMQLLQIKILDMEKAKHRTDENIRQQQQRRERRTCYNCNQPGHLIKDCRRPQRLSAHRQSKPDGTVKKPQGAENTLNVKGSG